MNGDRFDELTRLVARLGDRRQSRRSILRAAIGGGAQWPPRGFTWPRRTGSQHSIRSRNQEAASTR